MIVQNPASKSMADLLSNMTVPSWIKTGGVYVGGLLLAPLVLLIITQSIGIIKELVPMLVSIIKNGFRAIKELIKLGLSPLVWLYTEILEFTRNE